jgi:hypothetical protein
MATRLATGNYHNLSWAITADGALITLQINRKYRNQVIDRTYTSVDLAMNDVRDEIAQYDAFRQRHGYKAVYVVKDGK